MMIAKGLLASAAVAASLGTGGAVHASNQAHLQSMVDHLATEFSLNADEVETKVREFKGVRVSAIAQNGNDGQPHLEAFSDAFAAEFGVSADEVEAALHDYHTERRAVRAANRMTKAEKIERAVEQGRLTQEQADALFAKRQELIDFKASLEGMSTEDKKAAVKDFAQDLAVWADENEITLGIRVGANRAERMESRLETMDMSKEEKIQHAADTGVITQEQADAIFEQHDELQAFKASLDGLTEEERDAAVQDKAKEISDWARDNDINLGGKIGGDRADRMQAKAKMHTEAEVNPAPAPEPAPVE